MLRMRKGKQKTNVLVIGDSPVLHPREMVATGTKKRPHRAGVQLLRQVSYRQETYRAVVSLYAVSCRLSK
jgi:hypothetical protein